MTELKPCPFCGGKAETLTAESMNGGYLFGIMCNYCRSRGDVYDTEAEAIAAWNTRAERTCRMKPVYASNALECSECGSYVATWDAECDVCSINYCPNCGARVRSE